MFIGEYSHSIDNKGRLAIPAKFRAALKDGAVVTRGFDNCLVLYSKDKWDSEAEKLAKLPEQKADARAYSRLKLAGAMPVEFDNQGRITLPEYLRSYGKLLKKVVITGIYDRLELWDEDEWNRYREIIEKESNHIAEGLSEFGI